MSDQAPTYGTPAFWRWIDSRLSPPVSHEYIDAEEAMQIVAQADPTPDSDGRLWVERNGVRLKLFRTTLHDDVGTWCRHAAMKYYTPVYGARVYADSFGAISGLTDG